MLSRAMAGVLAARLTLAPFAAADPQMPDAGPIAASAARQAEALPPPRQDDRGPMPSGLNWTGIGLLMGSTAPVAVAKLGDCLQSRRACKDARHTAYAASGALALTGVALLTIGHAKRGPSPLATPIQASAARAADEAARDSADRPRRAAFRHPPVWTGLGLAAATPIPLLLAGTDGGCRTSGCRRERRPLYVAAGGLAFTGVTLMSVGIKGESPAPAIEVGAGRASIVQRIRF